MNTTKRIKLDPSPSPSPNDERAKEINKSVELEELEEHCTICLQSFLDRTIIPVCAHEFCFECILLWSEQSRKCPLCSRSFADAYLIHRIRSQYDYQKHYLPPLRTSPPPLTGESRANALRNTRRERQWGRRQRQQREEQDQLERAITRRRWLYQHHLYAKHVASNPYTRYRPFPTPPQFAASQELISRMTIFLRRELRVWPNLDVEFLTTYTISLMKSIDIRSESAVKLLSEFLDLDTPYTPGARQLNAEHFAHEIYSYLRSPYRDLNVYDQIVQYDTPPDISPPRDTGIGSRWSAGPSPPRSRSNSRRLSPVPHRANDERNVRDSSAEVYLDSGPSRRHSRGRSPRSTTPGREDRIHPSPDRSLTGSPPGGVREITLRNDYSHPRKMSCPNTSSSAVVAESGTDSVQSHFGDDQKGNDQAMENMEEPIPVTDTPKLNVPRDDIPAPVPTVDKAEITRPIEGTGGEAADYVDRVRGGSAANSQQSRKRLTGVHVHHRNRTLSESVQAYLSRPAATRHPTRKPPVEPARASDSTVTNGSTSETRPRLLFRLTDGPLDPVGNDFRSPVERTPNHDASWYGSDAASEQPHLGCRLPSRGFFPSGDDETSSGPTADRGPVQTRFPLVANVTPLTRQANAALSHSSHAVPDGHGGSASTHHGHAPQVDVGGIAEVDLRCDTGRRCDAVVSLTDRPCADGPSRTDTNGPMVDGLALETRLRTRARVRARLAAIKAERVRR